MKWRLYLLRRALAALLFLLFCLFALFVLVDLSINGVRFFTKGGGLSIGLYYLQQFAMHFDLFLPLAFLLASLKILFDLNGHLELVAFQSAGISRKQLLVPFFWIAALLSAGGYANHEWVAPGAVQAAQTFRQSVSKHPLRRETVQSIVLQDGSELVYHEYDGTAFLDVFWIRSPDEIWTMQSLDFHTGLFVEILKRDSEGLFTRADRFESMEINLPLGDAAPSQIAPFEGRSLSTLFREAALPSAERAGLRTYLHRKLAIPLLPPLIAFSALPFAMSFSRVRRGFLVAAVSLFGFVILMTLYDSLTILGENRAAPPFAMWLPGAAVFALSVRRFWKL